MALRNIFGGHFRSFQLRLKPFAGAPHRAAKLQRLVADVRTFLGWLTNVRRSIYFCMIPFSLLDVVPVADGCTVAEAIAHAADLAAHADRMGFSRYWVAEHHGISGIARAPTPIVQAPARPAERPVGQACA